MTDEPGARPALLRAQGVCRSYAVDGREVQALNGISLELPGGVFAVLRGRSGSGKTTLLNLLGGLDRPTNGEIFFEGQPLSAMDEAELTRLRRDRIGFIFQSFALLPTYSALENVELVLRIAGWGGQRAARQARACLQRVGLGKWLDHRPDEMSGGQQQRVGIARALATQPALLLADEPTGELDSATARQILALFHRLVEADGITVLLSSHDPIADEYADYIFQIQDGVLMGPDRI